MKTIIAFLLFALCSSTVLAQQPLPCGDRPCIYLTSGNSSMPVVQIDALQSLGNGLLAMTGKGTAIFAGATQVGGIGVRAVGVNGGIALYVQGPMVKPHEDRHLLKLYDPTTHALIASFEYSFE